MPDLSNARVLVVGGNGGIGRASATAFLAAGARVAVTWRRTDRSEAEADTLVETLIAGGFVPIEAEITDTLSLKRCADEIERRFGGLDILVHAAGFTQAIDAADLDSLTDELIDQIFAVNWRGQFATLRVMRPLLAASQHGLSVFISSIAATNGAGSNIAYGAAKAGVEVMVKSLARALAPEIRVLGLSPGVVETDFVPGRDASAMAKLAEHIPLRRIASPADVADAVVACATHFSYATGTTFVLDGGRLL